MGGLYWGETLCTHLGTWACTHLELPYRRPFASIPSSEQPTNIIACMPFSKACFGERDSATADLGYVGCGTTITLPSEGMPDNEVSKWMHYGCVIPNV